MNHPGRLHRIGATKADYQQRHFRGAKCIPYQALKLADVAVEDTRPQGVREEPYIYDDDDEAEGSDWEEYLPADSYFVKLYHERFAMIPEEGRVDMQKVRQTFTALCWEAMHMEGFLSQVYHQAKFNQLVAVHEQQARAGDNQSREIRRLNEVIDQQLADLCQQEEKIKQLEATASQLIAQAPEPCSSSSPSSQDILLTEIRKLQQEMSSLRARVTAQSPNRPRVTFEDSSPTPPPSALTVESHSVAPAAPAVFATNADPQPDSGPSGMDIVGAILGDYSQSTPDSIGSIKELEAGEIAEDTHSLAANSQTSATAGSSRAISPSKRVPGIHINPGSFYRLESIKVEDVLAFEKDARRHRDGNYAYEWIDHIAAVVKREIADTFEECKDRYKITAWKEWETLDQEQFFYFLFLCLGINRKGENVWAKDPMSHLEQCIQAWKPATSKDSIQPHREASLKLRDLVEEAERLGISATEQETLAILVSKKLIKFLSDPLWDPEIRPLKDKQRKLTTLTEALAYYCKTFNE